MKANLFTILIIFDISLSSQTFCQMKEGNPEVAVLFFPPSEENLSPYVSNINFTQNLNNDNISIKSKPIINEKEDYNIAPNPASNCFRIISSNHHEIYIEIVDINGILINAFRGSTNKEISINNIQKGIYFVKIYNNDQLENVQKIIIQ